MKYESSKNNTKLSAYMTVMGASISMIGTIFYGVWMLHSFVSNTESRIAILEANYTHVSDKIGQLGVALHRQEDKIDKIYLIMSSRSNKNAGID